MCLFVVRCCFSKLLFFRGGVGGKGGEEEGEFSVKLPHGIQGRGEIYLFEFWYIQGLLMFLSDLEPVNITFSVFEWS